jgi:hypothetical protein
MNLIPKLIDFYDEYARRTIKDDEYNYQKYLELAFTNTKKVGLEVPSFQFDEIFKVYTTTLDSGKYIVREDILKVIDKSVYAFPMEVLAFNCFSATELAHRTLKKELNIDSLITLGSFSTKGRKLFYESFQKLKYRINHKDYSTPAINLHAWLTLPDYSIIDLTLVSALKFLKQLSEIPYNNIYFIDSKYQNKTSPYSYHPILVGFDYLNKIRLPAPLLYFETTVW